MKGMNISSEKMPRYKHGCAEQGFYDVTKAQHAHISHNRVFCELLVVESGFIVQSKQLKL